MIKLKGALRSLTIFSQATDIHSEFMKAIDACHVKYQEDKVANCHARLYYILTCDFPREFWLSYLGLRTHRREQECYRTCITGI